MFKDDLKFEEYFYNNVFKHWLAKYAKSFVFVRYTSNNNTYNELQKKNDIDIIIDSGYKNVSLSLKVRREVYNDIFFETISNKNTGAEGWGFYSKADYHIYAMKSNNGCFKCYRFKIIDVRKLDIDKYETKLGSTKDIYGNLLYNTEGKIIPFCDFPNDLLFDNTKEL